MIDLCPQVLVVKENQINALVLPQQSAITRAPVQGRVLSYKIIYHASKNGKSNDDNMTGNYILSVSQDYF